MSTPEIRSPEQPIKQEDIPRCDKLDGSSLSIVPFYTEAGRQCEANCVAITDGKRTAVYVPYKYLGTAG